MADIPVVAATPRPAPESAPTGAATTAATLGVGMHAHLQGERTLNDPTRFVVDREALGCDEAVVVRHEGGARFVFAPGARGEVEIDGVRRSLTELDASGLARGDEGQREVAFVPGGQSFEELDVYTHGQAVRNHQAFAPAGTNANFATVIKPGHIEIRTYERGVEDETLACGTGMVACALIHHLLTGAPSPIKVDVAGGDTLEIGFQKSDGQSFKNVTLTGPADFVFEGDIEI